MSSLPCGMGPKWGSDVTGQERVVMRILYLSESAWREFDSLLDGGGFKIDWKMTAGKTRQRAYSVPDDIYDTVFTYWRISISHADYEVAG